MSVHSRIDKMLHKLLDVSSMINYLGQNITFPKLAVAQARISGRAEGREQGSLEMADLVCDKLIPNLETRAYESLRSLGEKFVTTLGKSGIGGALVRDKETGLPIKIHPTIKGMFPSGKKNRYYHPEDFEKIDKYGVHSDEKLKNPKKNWSKAVDYSVDKDMTQEEWEGTVISYPYPKYHTGELIATCDKNKLLSKIDNLPIQNILQDVQSKRSFHVHDWNKPSREVVTNLRALPPPPPP